MKKYVMHFLTHSEEYQLVVIGALALIWNFNSAEKWPEPLIYFLTVVFTGVALKKIIIRSNLNEEIEKIISRSDQIDNWYSNDQFRAYCGL